ncbi:MAG: hypothetical protein AB1847_16650 [bacterium]
MKDLLTAIKTALQEAESLASIRDADIYITEDETEIPPSTMYPAIEIKDGQIKNDQQIGGRYVQYAQVQITVYQRVMQPEQSLMGTKGVLAIAAVINTLLTGNRLGFLTGSGQVMNVFPIGETASQIMIIGETTKIQRKTIFLEYTRNIF